MTQQPHPKPDCAVPRAAPQVPASVLILAGDQANNAVMRVLLRRGGILADAADDFGLAHSMLQAGSYRLVICRHAMSLQLGIDLIGAIWNEFGVPGVLMTGTLTREQALKKVLPAALRGVLIMPISPAELLDTVRACLEEPCPDCHGKGEITLLVHKKRCLTCNGSGRIQGGRRG